MQQSRAHSPRTAGYKWPQGRSRTLKVSRRTGHPACFPASLSRHPDWTEKAEFDSRAAMQHMHARSPLGWKWKMWACPPSSGLNGYFTPWSTGLWLNEWTRDTWRAGLSAAASITSDELAWLSDAVKAVDGARTPRRHDRSSIWSLSRWGPRASPYVPVADTVRVRLQPPPHRTPHFPPPPAPTDRRLPLPLQGLTVHGPCVRAPPRGAEPASVRGGARVDGESVNH